MNFSRSALFHMKTRVCLEYFMNGCRINVYKIFRHHRNRFGGGLILI